MNKFFKTLLVVGGTAFAAHYGLKTYKRINGTVKLTKSLPEFLNNVYGEKPEIKNLTTTLNSLDIKLGFSQELIDKHNDIENTVQEYIDDFYPELSKNSIEISIYVKGTEPEAETVEEEVVAEESEEKE